MSYLTGSEKEKAMIDIYTRVYSACMSKDGRVGFAKQSAEQAVEDLKKEFKL